MQTPVRFVVARDIKSPSKPSVRVKWYVAARVTEEVLTWQERATNVRYKSVAYFVFLLRVTCQSSIFNLSRPSPYLSNEFGIS
jgi:hypothetical protein